MYWNMINFYYSRCRCWHNYHTYYHNKVKHQRGVVGASWEDIKAKRMQKPEVRAAQRQQAMRQNKEKKKAEQAAKKAEKAKVYNI